MTLTSLFYGNLLGFVGHVCMDLRQGEASLIYQMHFREFEPLSQIITTPPGFARDVCVLLNGRITCHSNDRL